MKKLFFAPLALALLLSGCAIGGLIDTATPDKGHPTATPTKTVWERVARTPGPNKPEIEYRTEVKILGDNLDQIGKVQIDLTLHGGGILDTACNFRCETMTGQETGDSVLGKRLFYLTCTGADTREVEEPLCLFGGPRDVRVDRVSVHDRNAVWMLTGYSVETMEIIRSP